MVVIFPGKREGEHDREGGAGLAASFQDAGQPVPQKGNRDSRCQENRIIGCEIGDLGHNFSEGRQGRNGDQSPFVRFSYQ